MESVLLWCLRVCLPVVFPVELNHETGGIWRLYSIKYAQAGQQSGYSGVMLWGTQTHTYKEEYRTA